MISLLGGPAFEDHAALMTMSIEQWVEARIWFSRFDLDCYKRLLLDFVKPVVQELEDSIDTFHFFFELKPNFLFRIKPLTGDPERIKECVRRRIDAINDFIVPKSDEETFEYYLGESEDFGQDGWEITKKIFEYGSRMAVAKLDPSFIKSKKFQEGKILHCFLNSCGHSNFGTELGGRIVTNEAIFHLDEFIGRMLILRGKSSLDQELMAEIDSIKTQREEWWRHVRIESI